MSYIESVNHVLLEFAHDFHFVKLRGQVQSFDAILFYIFLLEKQIFKNMQQMLL